MDTEEEMRAAFERAWVDLQRARIPSAPSAIGRIRMQQRIEEVAHLAADDELRPYVIQLLTVAQEISAKRQKSGRILLEDVQVLNR